MAEFLAFSQEDFPKKFCLGNPAQEQPVPGNDLLGVTATVTLKQINLTHDRKLICVV